MQPNTFPDQTNPDEVREFLSAEAARRERAHALMELAKADYLAAPFDPVISMLDAAIAYRAAVHNAKLADADYERAEREQAALLAQFDHDARPLWEAGTPLADAHEARQVALGLIAPMPDAEGEDRRLADLLAEFDAQQDRS